MPKELMTRGLIAELQRLPVWVAVSCFEGELYYSLPNTYLLTKKISEINPDYSEPLLQIPVEEEVSANATQNLS